jgi:hypothetical protein
LNEGWVHSPPFVICQTLSRRVERDAIKTFKGGEQMKLKTWSFVLVVVLILSACGSAEWKEFTSSEGGFSVSMPGAPQEETQTVPTAAGDIELHTFLVDQGASGYFVGYFDVPSELLAASDPGTLLNGGIQGAFGNIDGNIENQRDITLNGFPGIEASGTFSFEGETGTIKARAYLVNERVYQIYAAVQGTGGQSPDIDRFLDSFKLNQ